MVDVAPGLRDDLAAAIAEEETLAGADAAPEPAEKPAEAEAPETQEKPETPAGERPRGPDGKFLPADKAEAAAEKPAKPEAETAKKPDQPETVEKPAKPVADPIGTATARWSAADKVMLAKLPDETKQFLVRRHDEMVADHTRKTQEIAAFKRDYEPVDQLFAPYRQQMQATGHTPVSLIRAWANAEQQLMQGKGAEFLAKVIKDYRIDPAELMKNLGVTQQPTTGAAQPNGQIQLDPEVSTLLAAHLKPLLEPIQKQVGEVVGFTQAQRNEIARQQQAYREQELQSANQTVQQFIDAADKQGNLLHPYYEEVEAFMVTLAQAERAAGRKPDLERIYDQAVYATPSTREKLLAAQTAAQEANRQAEARAKATAARNAAVSVSGAPTGGPAPRAKKPAGTIREALEEAAADHEDAA